MISGAADGETIRRAVYRYDPESEALVVTPNPVLRYALSSFMLLVMSLCQWLFRWAIWDRFIVE